MSKTMSNDDAVELLVAAMLGPDKSESDLVDAVVKVQGAGLPVRDLYDQAREESARQGRYQMSFRELMMRNSAL